MARVFKEYRFYTKGEIEYRANNILRRMHRRGSQFAPSWPFDASLVADFLDLGVVWDYIPPDEYGHIAARILPLQQQIEINEAILDKPQGFQESTLAHEIGHWVLHVNQEVAGGSAEASEEDLFVCRGKTNLPQLESIEWQAQYFASCLLMPRHVLEEKSQGRDLMRWRHLYEIRDELGVSISNLVNRLQDLKWIIIAQGTRQIYPGEAVVNGEMRLFG